MKKINTVSLILAVSLLTACGTAKETVPSETPVCETTTVESTAATTARPRTTTAVTTTTTTAAETSETAEETSSTEPAATTAEPITVYSLSDDQFQDVYINDHVKVCTVFDDEYRQYFYEGEVYPVLTIDSDDARRINSEIEEMTSHYISAGNAGMSFNIIRNSDTVFTLLIQEWKEEARVEYHPYVIDTATGEQLTNSEIMQMAGVDEDDFTDLVRESIMTAYSDYDILEYYNDGEDIFVNGELNIHEGLQEYLDSHYLSIDTVLSEDNINNDMPIFLDHEGNLLIAPKMLYTDGYDHSVLDLNGTYPSQSQAICMSYTPAEGISVRFDHESRTIVFEQYTEGEEEYIRTYWNGEEFVS